MSTSATLTPQAPTTYWDLLHQARQLPRELQEHLGQALAEGISATTRYRAVITRDPLDTGDHTAMNVEVYSFSRLAPDPALVSTAVHSLRRPLPHPSYTFDTSQPGAAEEIPGEALGRARDAIAAARAAYPALLARSGCIPSTQARVGLDLLLEQEEEVRADAAAALEQSLRGD